MYIEINIEQWMKEFIAAREFMPKSHITKNTTFG